MATLPTPKTVLREGTLQKRQRGKHVKGNNYTGLKFQSRFVSLDTEHLHYFRDKKHKGKFPVSSIAFVEEVSFEKVKYGFQIGNEDQSEVMFFGAASSEDRSKWMEAIRLGAKISKNVMASHYHPGAYGKVVQGQWSCCRKGKTAQGCCETGFRNRPQSEMLVLVNPVTQDERDYDGDDDDDDSDSNEHSKSVPSNVGGKDKSLTLKVKPPLYRASVVSADSGMYESRSSLTPAAGVSGAQVLKWTEEQDGESRCKENHKISQMLENHDYTLLVASDYGAALNSLDFRGNDSLVVGRKGGKVHVLDVANHGSMLSAVFPDEVTSVETWRSLLLVSTNGGVSLHDLDDREFNRQLEFITNNTLESVTVDTKISAGPPPLEPASEKEYLAAFTPDGSRIVMAYGNTLEVKEIGESSAVLAQKLPGKILLLCISPDQNLPKVVACVVKNDILLLCICDYMDDKDCSEINIDQSLFKVIRVYSYYSQLAAYVESKLSLGPYESSSSVCAHFLPSDTKLAVGHGKTVTIVKIAPGLLKPEVLKFITQQEVTSLRYSPIGDHLVLGMNDGNVVVLDGRANTFSVQHTLEFSSQSIAAVTALAFSKDCSLLAVGQEDGKLNVVTRSFIMKKEPETKEPPSVSIPVSGGTLKSKEDGISVVFSAGFIAQPSLTFQCCVKTHENPHTFPPGVRPVSAVLALHPESDVTFLKPVEVTIPHFIDLEDEDDCERLKVFVAGPNKPGEEGLHFKAMSQDAVISLFTSGPYKHRKQYATFSIKHCCHFCVGEFYTKKDTDKALLVLARAQSKLKADNYSRELFLHHCFHYDLPTCSKLVKEQFPEESYTLTNYLVRFSGDRNPSVGIKVDNSRELEGKGWNWCIDNGTEENRICPKDIDFWEIPTRRQLEHMCQQSIYPPRFILRVFSNSPACKDAHMKVAFPGVVYEWPRQKPILTVSLKGVDTSIAEEIAVSRGTSSQSFVNSRRRVLSQPSQTVNKYAAKALQSLFPFLCKEVTAELAIHLYSRNFFSDYSHIDKYMETIGKCEPGSLEKMQMIHNWQLLRHVQTCISKDPGKFDVLCAVLDDLNPQCSQKLRDTADALHEKEINTSFVSTSTLSGSEQRSTSPSHALDNAPICEESTIPTPGSSNGCLHFEPNVPRPSDSDISVFPHTASAGDGTEV